MIIDGPEDHPSRTSCWGNPTIWPSSKQRRQLATDPLNEFCVALSGEFVEPENIKEAMAGFCMDRKQCQEQEGEIRLLIRNKARIIAKGYGSRKRGLISDRIICSVARLEAEEVYVCSARRVELFSCSLIRSFSKSIPSEKALIWISKLQGIVALDNSLVGPEKRLKIEKCNARIAFSKPQREETYQVTLDALKLSPCYPVFIITAEVPDCTCINSRTPSKDTNAYRFKLDKKKFRVDTKELGSSGKCISGKTIGLDRLRESQAQILWGMYNKKNVDYVSLMWEDLMYQANNRDISVIIRDTLGVSVSMKKAPAKADKGKGIDLLFDATLLEDARLKKALEKSKQDTNKLQASGSSEGADFESEVPDESKAKPFDTSEGTGVKQRVPDVLKANSSDSDNESWGDSDDDNDDDNANDDDSKKEDDDGNDTHDSERTNSDDDDENPSFTLKDYDEEEHDEDYESDDDNENVYEEEDDDLYKDVDVRSLGVEHEKEGKKTESSKQSSSVSSDFASKFLILDNVPPVVDEVASMMNIKNLDDLLSTRIGYATQTALQSYTKEFERKAQEERKLYIDVVEKSVKDIIKDEVKSLLPQILPKEVSDFATPMIQSTINESLKNVILAKSSSQPKSTYKAAVSLTEFELKKILLDKIEKSKLNVYSLKRDREDEDKDEDPPAGLNQGLMKRKMSKDAEPPKGSKSKESKTSSSKGTKPQAKSSGKSTQVEEPVFEAADTEMQQDQGSKFGHAVDKPNGEAAPKSDWFKKPNKPLTPDRAWNTTKSIDFRPPQTWISNIAKAREPPCMFDELMSTLIDFSAYVMNHLKIDNLTQKILVGSAFNLLKGSCKILADYFFNNDLEYLKGGSSSRKYTTSTTKTKAAKYDNIEGIEDMFMINRESKHDVFSRKRIIAVTHVKVMKWYGYGYSEEIIIRREDQKLHKFKEGDFPRLNLRDIVDFLLLLV
ncbi:hypothetical protein Tco_1254730 [Tanacetum coccineum]